MAKLVIDVRRIEKVYEGKVVAQILAYRKGSAIAYKVKSENELFVNHLEQILAASYYMVLPGPFDEGYFANHVEYFYPQTLSFFAFLHDRLSWYGYLTEVLSREQVTKSIFYREDEYDSEAYFDAALLKSFNWGDYTRINKEGHTILVTVPPGYVAVSKGGKVVKAGRKVGRNGVDLDKADAKWSLVKDDETIDDAEGDEWRMVPNEQWEKMYGSDPDAAKKAATKQLLLAAMGKPADYHPGMYSELYDPEGSGVVQTSPMHQKLVEQAFNSGVSLQNIMQDSLSGTLNDQALGGSDELPAHVLLMSNDPDSGFKYLIPASVFAKYKHLASDWVMFDGSEFAAMSDEQKTQMRLEAQKNGQKYHPALINGAFDKPKKIAAHVVDAKLDVSAALPHNIKDLFIDGMTSVMNSDKKEVSDEEVKVASDYVAAIFKESEGALTKREAKLKRTKKTIAQIKAINDFDRALESEYFTANPQNKKQLIPRTNKFGDRLTSVLGLTGGKGSEDIYFDHIEDDGTKKGLRMHQIYTLKGMTNTDRYAAYGGPEESDGYMLQHKPGLGKSFIILAADAVMRNKGAFKGTHILTGPKAVIPNWAEDLRTFRKKEENKDFFVIDGSRQERAKKWEKIRALTGAGKPPQFVLIGSGKMAFESKVTDTGDTDEDAAAGDAVKTAGTDSIADEVELSMDLKYMRDIFVETGNLAALTIDETGLYTNPDAKRHQVLRAMVNLATSETNTKGDTKKERAVVWTLNGNLMGNSATDALVEAGWVNAGVRANLTRLRDALTFKPFKSSNRRVFNPETNDKKSKQGLTAFMRNFGHSINRMGYVKAVGKNHKNIAQVQVAVGPQFADVYNTGLQKLEALYNSDDKKLQRYKLSMITLMLNASNNAAKVARLIEYGLDGRLMKDMSQLLPPKEFAQLKERIAAYRQKTCSYQSGIGYLPFADNGVATDAPDAPALNASQRDMLFTKTVGPHLTKLMQKVISNGAEPVSYQGNTITGWKNPLAEFVATRASEAMQNKSLIDRLRLGFQSQSRMVTESVYAALGKKASMQRQLLVGGMKPSEIKKMQTAHAEKKGNPIMSLLTSAATYGVNFNSDIAFVTDTWNPARREQGFSRFHRNVMRPVLIYMLSSTGIGQILRDVAKQKASWAEAAENIDFSDEDATEKVLESILGPEIAGETFLEKLKNTNLVVEH